MRKITTWNLSDFRNPFKQLWMCVCACGAKNGGNFFVAHFSGSSFLFGKKSNCYFSPASFCTGVLKCQFERHWIRRHALTHHIERQLTSAHFYIISFAIILVSACKFKVFLGTCVHLQRFHKNSDCICFFTM